MQCIRIGTYFDTDSHCKESARFDVYYSFLIWDTGAVEFACSAGSLKWNLNLNIYYIVFKAEHSTKDLMLVKNENVTSAFEMDELSSNSLLWTNSGDFQV